MYSGLKIWVTQQENKSLKIAMALIIISMAALFCYVRGKVRIQMFLINLKENCCSVESHGCYVL